MNDKQRLVALIDYFCSGNNAEFARQIGISAQTLNNWLSRGLSKDALSKIASRWNEINANWLLTGDGSMIDNQDINGPACETEYLDAVPLVPIEAMAGSLSVFSQGVSLQDCRKIKSPVTGADWAIQVSGDSMEPEIHNGSYLFIRKLNGTFIPWGNTMVIDTFDGVVVKKIYPIDGTDEYILAKSVNPNYPPFKIAVSEIIGVYRILGWSYIVSTM